MDRREPPLALLGIQALLQAASRVNPISPGLLAAAAPFATVARRLLARAISWLGLDYLRLHLLHVLRHRIQWHSGGLDLSIKCHLDGSIWLHHSQLWHAHCCDWIRSWLGLDHLRLDLFDDLRHGLFWYGCFVDLSIGCHLERTIGLHHSQLRYSFRFDWLRSWQCVLNHVWLHLYNDLRHGLQRHRRIFELPGRRDLVGSIWLHHHQLCIDPHPDCLRHRYRLVHLRLHAHHHLLVWLLWLGQLHHVPS